MGTKSDALQEIILRQVPISSVLDVGVQMGTPELIEAFPDRKHYLFEPVTDFNQSIETAYASIAHEVHNVALSDQNGTIAAVGFTPLGGVNVGSGVVASGGPTFPRITLDTFVSNHEPAPPYFLKIDVDGHEMAVLRGAIDTLAKCSVVMIELEKREIVQRMQFLYEAHFELFDLVESCYYDKSFWQCDGIFIRRNLQREIFRQLGADFDRSLYLVRR